MSVVADYPDWSPHVAHANQIAATGVPLLTLNTRLYQQAFPSVAAGTPVSSGPLNVSQVGYEVQITAKFPVATVTPFVEIQVAWTDTTSGLQIGSDTFIVPGATAPGVWTVHGRGPTKANQLNLTVTNLDASNAASVGVIALQNSRVYQKDEWYWVNPQNKSLTIPGFPLPTFPDDESVLGLLDGITIPASSQASYLFGMHAGMVSVGYEVNTGAASNLSIRIRPKPDTVYSGHNIIYSAVTPPANFQVAAPRAPLGVVLVNAATTAMVMSMSMIRAD